MFASIQLLTASATLQTTDGHLFTVPEAFVSNEAIVMAHGAKRYVLPGPDGSFSLAQFGGNLQKAVHAAAGRRIVIPAGTWSAVDVDISGAWIEFADGAKIIATLNASQNVFTTTGGTRLIRPVIEVTNSALPTDGSNGNIIMMGSYVTAGELYSGLEIVDPIFTAMNTTAMGLAVSCAGRCENVHLIGKMTLRGRFAGGFQAHWGGMFAGDPHTAQVSASYHPNKIRIDTLYLQKGGPANMGGYLGLSLSAAYDVEVGTIINRGWARSSWIQPGDVYDLVAAPDQKDKIMSGIFVRYTEVINPVALTGGYNNVLVSGVSATIRTPGQTEVVCAADRRNMHVDHGKVRFLCQAGHRYNTIPLVRMLYAKNCQIKVDYEGFTALDAPTTGLFQSVKSTDCLIEASSRDAPRLISGYGNIRNRYILDWRKPKLPAQMGPWHRAIGLGQVGGIATIAAPAAKGATVLRISAWSGTAASLDIKGTRFYLADGSFVTLSRSQMVGKGATVLAVEPIPANIAASATLGVTGKEFDSVIEGLIEGAHVAIELTNVDGVSIPARCSYSASNGIVLTGTINRRVLANGSYGRCGQIRDRAGGVSTTTQ